MSLSPFSVPPHSCPAAWPRQPSGALVLGWEWGAAGAWVVSCHRMGAVPALLSSGDVLALLSSPAKASSSASFRSLQQEAL